jgi:hypothetical protein
MTVALIDPKEIYVLEPLGRGVLEPPQSLIDEMNRRLDDYAATAELPAEFSQRSGTQFKIATDELQYYIIRRYET